MLGPSSDLRLLCGDPADEHELVGELTSSLVRYRLRVGVSKGSVSLEWGSLRGDEVWWR